jgi:archaeal flagellar protein FlaI
VIFMFAKKISPGSFELIKEGEEEVMKINYEGLNINPSIEDSPECMADTIDKIIQVPSVNRIILYQRRNYEYNYEQTQILREIANIYSHLTRQKRLMSIINSQISPKQSSELRNIVITLLKSDPIGSYVELKRILREQKITVEKSNNKEEQQKNNDYLLILEYIYGLLDKSKLIKSIRESIEGMTVGSRVAYKSVFRANITPDFMITRLLTDIPLDAVEVDAYKIDEDNEVTIFRTPNDIKYFYHLNPIEFKITEDEFDLIETARQVLSEHQPKSEEFVNPEKIRQTFFNIGRDLITELAEHKNINLEYSQIKKLAEILVRYTVGFGLIEILLKDERIQDISINGPIGETSIFIVHQDYEECTTNILPSTEDGNSWATKFRILSGRPLDEANPVLDTELLVPGAKARVAIIGDPLNPLGLGYSFRRHRDNPWTLPLFIDKGMLNSIGAGLISFLVDGNRSIIVAGTRSSGKTSLLGSIMVEIMRKYRIITVEDTLELPTESLRKLGYNIQPMKVRAALAVAGGSEVSADEGIRTSLRMGDSSLIIGEIRSKEALALYEAMRIGALANVVAGTIHGDSPYGVYDRVVNDLQVPKTSFKATDIIIVANPIRTSDGMHKKRRVVSITEVRKEWDEDPLKQNGFVDLMRYNPKTDQLEMTDSLINGDSDILKAIASNVKDWAGNWDAVWENIMLRASIKKTLVEVSNKLKMPILLEAEFVIQSNDEFHRISNDVRDNFGNLDSKRIFFEWNEWLKKQIKLQNKR